jgi:hypothetical protein
MLVLDTTQALYVYIAISMIDDYMVVSDYVRLAIPGTNYHILLSIVRTFYIENNAEIFPVHYTWKVAEKGFKLAFVMNKLAMNNSF